MLRSDIGMEIASVWNRYRNLGKMNLGKIIWIWSGKDRNVLCHHLSLVCNSSTIGVKFTCNNLVRSTRMCTPKYLQVDFIHWNGNLNFIACSSRWATLIGYILDFATLTFSPDIKPNKFLLAILQWPNRIRHIIVSFANSETLCSVEVVRRPAMPGWHWILCARGTKHRANNKGERGNLALSPSAAVYPLIAVHWPVNWRWKRNIMTQ